MGKCNSYRVRVSTSGRSHGVCYGTKECEICFCGGDASKCDFYSEKKDIPNKMLNTVEKWLEAQKDGKNI